MNNLLFEKINNLGLQEANQLLHQQCGIVEYFSSETEKQEFLKNHLFSPSLICEERIEYGDWQTPQSLADKICKNHKYKFGSPDIILEPTCGLGAFVLSSLKHFPNAKEIHAIEINDKYLCELKYKILLNAISCPSSKYPDIYLYKADFFKFDLSSIFEKIRRLNWKLALIGNPPWVTNSKQGRLSSTNVPIKSNKHKLRGIDAITGKSNFDISEFITLDLLQQAQECNGGISFLLKNSVIRNIISKQKTNNLSINDIEQFNIDASKEFQVSVEASCFTAKFNSPPSLKCKVLNLYTEKEENEYGWSKDVFVSNITNYKKYSAYCGNSSFIWRSGIKHDCSSILEISQQDDKFIKGLGEEVNIESDLLYPLLKSSDINKYNKDFVIKKYVLIPQHRIGQDTSELAYTHPLTYKYLLAHEDFFRNRRSSIYRDKDKFSMFGLGLYTFKPYKIEISSLYKNLNFVLLSKYNEKPIIVDDTCYQLDFDTFEEANSVISALQSPEISGLLNSLVFYDAKRIITKSLLMKIDLIHYFKEKGIMLKGTFKKNGWSKQLSLFDNI